MRILLAAVLTTLMPLVAVADDTDDNYSARVQQEIERLEKDYVKFQKSRHIGESKTAKKLSEVCLNR